MNADYYAVLRGMPFPVLVLPHHVIAFYRATGLFITVFGWCAMLSMKYNFLFIHTHKTGGNSIQLALLPYADDQLEALSHSHKTNDFEIKSTKFPTLRKHSSLYDYQLLLDKKTFKRLYKFACIRNPWERLISFYFSPHRGVQPWSREDFIKMMDTIPPAIDMFITQPRSSQTPSQTGLDFVMKFENLAHDFRQACEHIGLLSIELPHRNRSKRNYYLDYYDKELALLVEERYTADISLFGYTNPFQ